MLDAHQLAIGYAQRIVGRGFDVALRRGEVLALLGPNGCGKTTLMKTLLGLIPPKGGTITMDGRSLAAYETRERARRLAYVPQTHASPFAFTVEEVVLMGRTAHAGLLARPSSRDREVVRAVIERLGHRRAGRTARDDDLGRRTPARPDRAGAGAGTGHRDARRAYGEPRLRESGKGHAGDEIEDAHGRGRAFLPG